MRRLLLPSRCMKSVNTLLRACALLLLLLLLLVARSASAEVITRYAEGPTSNTGSQCVMAAPTVSNGDLMVEYVESRGGNGIGAPAGWTCGTEQNYDSDYFSTNICSKIA